MVCPDKQDLQKKCTTALNVYQSAVKDLDLPIDPLTGAIRFRPLRERSSAGALDPKTGLVKQPYLDVMALHRAYREASKALSKHLSTHRC